MRDNYSEENVDPIGTTPGGTAEKAQRKATQEDGVRDKVWRQGGKTEGKISENEAKRTDSLSKGECQLSGNHVQVEQRSSGRTVRANGKRPANHPV